MIRDVACDVAPEPGGQRFAGAGHRLAEAGLELRGGKSQLGLDLAATDVQNDRAVGERIRASLAA